MSLSSRDSGDLVGFALGALPPDEMERVRGRVVCDPDAARELEAVRRHLALHEPVAAAAVEPSPELWDRLRDAIAQEPVTTGPTPSPAFPGRFWMPAAAALLVAAAFLWPRGDTRVAPAVTHGRAVVRAADGSFTCPDVARMRIGDGVTMTADANTRFALHGPERLALRAGRVFLEVTPAGRGFVVETAHVRAVTTGTAFAVEAGGRDTRVGVERGSVRCEHADGADDLAAGEALLVAGDGVRREQAGALRAWFDRPALEAKMLAETTLRVVVRNEMPFAIRLAPPTGGEPLFYAAGSGHSYPLAPSADANPWRSGPVMLDPGAALVVDLRLPRPLGDREAFFVSHPLTGARAPVTRTEAQR